MTVGERIRAARKRAGLTQKELSEKIRVSEITVRQWENTKRTPNLKRVHKIASTLDVPFEYLILDEDERNEEMKNDLNGIPEIEEKAKKLSDEIPKDTQEAGLPWYAGLFNPKIVNAAIKDNAEQVDGRKQIESQFEQDMDDLRKIQKERDKLMLEADKTVLEAIQCAAEMMKSLQEEEEEKGVTAMGAADLGRAIAAMRESLNQKHYPVGYYGTV